MAAALDVDARRLPVLVETTAYIVVAEALTNVVKHAGVGNAAVRAALGENGEMRLEITDEGTGGADAGRGTGLRGLADRVEAGGGSFQLDSPPGGGTRIRASLPVPPRLTPPGVARRAPGSASPASASPVPPVPRCCHVWDAGPVLPVTGREL